MADWVLGDTICIEPHIPICDWIYGDTLCITLPLVVYPTSAKVRVTSLVHRWTPGNYTLQIGLGELTTEFDIDDIIMRPPITQPVPPAPPTPIPGACWEYGVQFPEGSYVCRHGDKYTCINANWVLTQEDSPDCGVRVCYEYGVEFQEGSYICRHGDKYTCSNGDWVLTQRNSPDCGIVPPPPPVPNPPVGPCSPEGNEVCYGADLYICRLGAWHLKERNAVKCHQVVY